MNPSWIASIDWFIPVLTLYREGRNQELEALRAIAHVIVNRVNDPRWPNTPSKVCLNHFDRKSKLPPFAPYKVFEFTSFSPKDPNCMVWPANDQDVAWGKCAEAWYVAGHEGDFTGGANFYHSFEKESQYPSWATKESFTMEAGAFKLYRR